MKKLLEIKDITKEYPNLIAVNNVSLSIGQGERIGIIGANGAGKTTLCEMITGVKKPTEGSVEYFFDYEKTFKEKIGMQFQDSNYPSGLTVKDIIDFARGVYKIEMSNVEIRRLLKTFMMEDFYNRKAKALSGGQRQKLNILLAVLHSPKLVILDEISTGLDISAREEIINFTNKLLDKTGATAIIISHHMGEIKSIAKRIIAMHKGEIIIDATTKAIEKKYKDLDAFARKLVVGEKVSLTSKPKRKAIK